MAMHPMMKPASWALWSGSGGIPAVHRAAAVFWLAGGVMLAVWVIGLIYEAMVWGVSPLLLILGLSVAAGWCWLAWSTWSAWRADQTPLTLLWTGPVRERDDDAGARHAIAEKKAAGGFRVTQWDAPVRVEVLLDLQRWMLLRLSTTSGASRQAWLWLAATPVKPLHHLRALVYLPSRLTVPIDRAIDRTKAPTHEGASGPWLDAMASWLHVFKPGSKLRSSAHVPDAPRRLHAASSSMESVFPSTLVMRDDEDHDAPVAARAGERA